MNVVLGCLIVVVIACAVYWIRAKDRSRKNLPANSPVQHLDFPARDTTAAHFGDFPLDSSDGGSSIITVDAVTASEPLKSPGSGSRLGRSYTTPPEAHRSPSFSMRKMKRNVTSSSIGSRASINETYEAAGQQMRPHSRSSDNLRRSRGSSYSSMTGLNLSRWRRSMSSVGDGDEHVALMSDHEEENFVFSPDALDADISIDIAGSSEPDSLNHMVHVWQHSDSQAGKLVLETIEESPDRELSPPTADFSDATWVSEPEFQLATSTSAWKALMQQGRNLQSDF